MRSIRFSAAPPKSGRRHFVDQAGIEVVLSRLPADLWAPLRGVHLNDQAWGRRILGYVTKSHSDIALCALPRRVSLNAYCRHDRASPAEFGAQWGAQWPERAVRRFMLYNVFLHELGHLQVFDEGRPSRRLRFYHEKLAQEFADSWRHRLWSSRFEHPDQVHNRPVPEEINTELSECGWVVNLPAP
jgi:hypothetical protein